METSHNYKLSLLYLTHLVIGADGDIDEKEMKALSVIRMQEKIPDDTFEKFTSDVKSMRERDIYYNGIELISTCTDKEKLRAFALLLKLTEADGKVHIKEVRFLLYSAKSAGIDFDDVTIEAAKLPITFKI